MFGAPQQLTTQQLPTAGNVIRHYLQLQEELIPGLIGEDASFADVARLVCGRVGEVRQRASLPTEQLKSTVRRLKKLIARYYSVKKSLKQSKNMKARDSKRRDRFREECDYLV